MRPRVCPGILLPLPTLALTLAIVAPAGAHYHMLFPQSASGQREQSMSFRYQWGHPFEHQLFDPQQPDKIVVYDPDGKPTEAAKNVQKVEVREGGKSVSAFEFAYTPLRRGDHTVVVAAPPVWLAEEKIFVHDAIKVVLHVQTQNGWDRVTDQAFEIVPLTRPYGLQPGIAFQGQALQSGKPLAGVMIEVERYNPTPPKDLPPDEQITRRVKADPNGVFTATLTDGGWWCLTAERDGGKRDHDGKMYPVRQRTTFWVFVDDFTKPAK